MRAFCRASVQQDVGVSERLGDDLDGHETAGLLPIPVLPADSSQLESLGHARQGRHLLVYGPPGTGKSQTISNLIADALGQGKTVLFVSAKMAALEVVHDRLSKLGFDRFCLEAHSTKAGKARIIDELRRALDAAGQLNGADHAAEMGRMGQLRASLNEAVRELHRRREPLGRSVYQGLGQFAVHEKLQAVQAVLPWPDPTSASQDALEQVLDILRDLQAEAATFSGRATHPWRGCVVKDASYATVEALLSAFAATRIAQGTVLSASERLAPFVGSLEGLSFAVLQRGADALRALSQATWLPAGWTTAAPKSLSTRAVDLHEAADTVRKLEGLRAEFENKTEGGDPTKTRALLVSGLDRFGAWYKRLRPAYFAWKKEVREKVRPKAPDYGYVADLARLANEIAVEANVLEADRADLEPLLKESAGLWPEIEALEDAARGFELAGAIRSGRAKFGCDAPTDEPLVVDALTRATANAVLGQVPTENVPLERALKDLSDAWEGKFDGNAKPVDIPLIALAARCAEAETTPQRLGEWVVLREILDRSVRAGLEPFVQALEPHGSGRAVDLFRRRFWLLWSDAYIARVQCLNLFSGGKRDEVVREFTTLDNRLRKLSAASSIDGAAQRCPDQASHVRQPRLPARHPPA